MNKLTNIKQQKEQKHDKKLTNNQKSDQWPSLVSDLVIIKYNDSKLLNTRLS